MTDGELRVQPWHAGAWTTAPAAVAEDGPDVVVTAVEGSDAWRHTAYGFVHDDAHALLAPLASPGAVEVTFDVGWDGQFDQAGWCCGPTSRPGSRPVWR